VPDDVPPLSAAYIKRLLFCTVLIERFYQTHAGRPASDSASGIIIGKGTRFGPPHVNVATAAHVLEDTPTLPVRWCISRLDSLDGTVHVATFTTHKPIAEEPMLFRPKNPGDFDVAMISTFNRATVQRSKPARDVEFIDWTKWTIPLTTPPTGHLLPGTHVAWAGYPGFVQQLTGLYFQCYYQGTVSAYVPSPRPLYLVDGHAAHGVSGGPIWFCRPDGQPVVLGVVSSYEGAKHGVPGLCAFTPINVLFERLEMELSE